MLRCGKNAQREFNDSTLNAICEAGSFDRLRMSGRDDSIFRRSV